MEDKEKIILNEDDKAVCLNALKELNGQLSFMYQLIQEDRLDENTRDTLSSLFEYSMTDISEKTGYDSLSAKVLDEKYKAIREANVKIRELERKIGSEDLTDKIEEQISYLIGLVDKWWDIEGFQYIRDISFRKYGMLEAELGFSFMGFSSRYSDKPVTAKIKYQTWIEELEERGFNIISGKRRDSILVDCESNRELLISMIKNRFPSVEILQFENYNASRKRGSELFEIRGLKILIRDIRDVKNLESYISRFHEVEEYEE